MGSALGHHAGYVHAFEKKTMSFSYPRGFPMNMNIFPQSSLGFFLQLCPGRSRSESQVICRCQALLKDSSPRGDHAPESGTVSKPGWKVHRGLGSSTSCRFGGICAPGAAVSPNTNSVLISSFANTVLCLEGFGKWWQLLLLPRKKPYLKTPEHFPLFRIGSNALNVVGKFSNRKC